MVMRAKRGIGVMLIALLSFLALDVLNAPEATDDSTALRAQTQNECMALPDCPSPIGGCGYGSPCGSCRKIGAAAPQQAGGAGQPTCEVKSLPACCGTTTFMGQNWPLKCTGFGGMISTCQADMSGPPPVCGDGSVVDIIHNSELIMKN